MAGKVHPLAVSVTPKELREIQKLHELGKKYWPAADTVKFEEEAKLPEPTRWRYYLRHPYARLSTSYLVTFCNFLIFAEDPVSHSYSECNISIIGDIYSFMCIKWPTGSFIALKLGLWLLAILLGLLIGKYVIHKWIFCDKLKLRIFTEDGQGSWMVMFMTTVMSLYIFSFIYNGFLMLEGQYMDRLHASPFMRMQNQTFMKFAALGTWLGDFLTAWMVTDMMLQGMKYPHWAHGPRKVWKRGLTRVYAFWFVAVAMTVVVITGIATDFVDWDRMNRNFVSSNEISRAFLASCIIVMDLLIVMQDWEFPYFAGSLDVKLPGMNTDSVSFHLPACCGGERPEVYITGKWFNYGIIFIVMILDLNMWKNQIFYSPLEYGQYTDQEGFIYSVADKQFLRWANSSMMTYEWRWGHVNPKTNMTYGIDDHRMNAKYKGYSLILKGLAFVPSLATFCLFGYLLWVFGQEENPDDVLVRKYRCDVRKRRQLARLRKKRKLRARRRRVAALQAASLQAAGLPLAGLPGGPRRDPTRSDANDTTLNITLDGDAEEEVKPEEPAGPAKPRRDFLYFLRHPYSRISIAYLIVFCNFLIFAEDPVSHSSTDCVIAIIGNMYSFVFSRYPPHAGYVALKVFMFTSAAIVGMLVGKFFLHKFLLCRVLKLKIFTEDGQGSWMVMFMTVLLFLYMWSFVYSEFLILGGYAAYVASSNLGIKNQTFMKFAAMGTWLGDFLTAWMVTDMMLQENDYPKWCRRLRKFWRRGLNRVYMFWFVAFGMSAVVATAISTDYLDWDRISRDFMPTNELSRAFLASFILVMDLLIVMQDWEFPHFSGGMDVKLPGINTGEFKFHLPGGDVHISGKWFNYGIIFIVMILDMNMWKNQIYYEPFDYGQYTDPDGYIYTVSDRDFIANATRDMMSYAWRWNHTDPLTNLTYGSQDHKMNSRYIDFPFRIKGIAFFPSLFGFAVFGLLAKLLSGRKQAADAKSPKRDPSESDSAMQNLSRFQDLEADPTSLASLNVRGNNITSEEGGVASAGDVISAKDDVTDEGSRPTMPGNDFQLDDLVEFQRRIDSDLVEGIGLPQSEEERRSPDGDKFPGSPSASIPGNSLINLSRKSTENLSRKSVDSFPRNSTESISRNSTESLPRKSVESLPRKSVESLPRKSTGSISRNSRSSSLQQNEHIELRPMGEGNAKSKGKEDVAVPLGGSLESGTNQAARGTVLTLDAPTDRNPDSGFQHKVHAWKAESES